MLKIEQSSTNSRFCRRFDFVLWSLIAVLPVITWCLYLFRFNQTGNPLTMSAWLEGYFIFTSTTNPIHGVLLKLFGWNSSFFPFLSTSWVSFFTWFCTVEIVHLAVDVLLFIVRLAHKWIGGLIS